MKIERIEKKNNKYKIHFDNGDILNTYDQVIIDNKILYAKDIDDTIYQKIVKDTNEYDLYDKCIKLITKKLRSKKEIADYLYKQTDNENLINWIIDKLLNNGLINDTIYVKAYINDKINFTNDGPYKIKDDLSKNNIDDDIINQELTKIDNDVFRNKVEKYINKKINSNKTSAYQFKQKILNDLINKGYTKEMILEYLDNIKIDSNIKQEYEKIYVKLSKKYSGNELNYKVRNKLYQKGYNTEEINEIIK